MSRKRSLPAWHESTGFQPDMSLFDGPSDKIIDKPMPNSRPTSQVATKGKTAAWQAISGVTGLGKTFQMRNPLDSIINDDDESGTPESGHPTMDLIISELPPKPTHRIVPSGLPPRPPTQQKVQYAPKNVPVESLPKSSYVPRYGDDWHDRYSTQKTGGASRKMRKSRRARRVKTQMRRKNSSRKSTRRRTRK